MSDEARSPQQPSPSGPLPPGRPSSSGLRVLSAAREQPLAPEPKRPLKQRLASGASNSALNGLAVLRELVEDFRNQDRFFKYKALILGLWVLLSATSLGVACQNTGLKRSADLGARLVLAGDAQRPVYTVFNDSTDVWRDVVVIINGRYRAATALVKPGGNVTLTPRQLMGEDGQLAPSDLRALHLEVRTTDGDEVLMQDGKLE